ncbi:MAG TPA: hypothetical protein VNV38_03735 [Stellaceae bacterium]|jgi:hypothetical protein|nr:hypothetical protein [Stellaceae bacterium]
MAAIENIIAWAQQEQVRLTQQLAELQAGRLRTCEKHAQAPGWLEVDTTEHTIEHCRHYLSELSAIIALHPAVVPTEPAAPPPTPQFIPPRPQPAEEHPGHPEIHGHLQQAIHADWVVGWGVVKGQPPRWTFAGIYPTHAEANEAAAEAGAGYYARWGSYNERRKEFTSGPSFARPGAL